MDIRTKDHISENYNRISKWYDAVAGRNESQLRKAGLIQLDATHGETILEIGFGTGHSIVEIAQAVGVSGKVYGIDVSDRMLELAQARAAATGHGNRIILSCGNALILPYADNSFDALFMSFTLEVFEEEQVTAFLHQCKRVIRPDGRICVVAMSARGRHTIMMKVYEWAHRAFPNTIDCRPIDAEQLLLNAGFRTIKQYISSFWGLSVEIVESRKPAHV